MNHLKVRSCLSIEVRKATLASNAFDLLELNGTDLRRETPRG